MTDPFKKAAEELKSVAMKMRDWSEMVVKRAEYLEKEALSLQREASQFATVELKSEPKESEEEKVLREYAETSVEELIAWSKDAAAQRDPNGWLNWKCSPKEVKASALGASICAKLIGRGFYASSYAHVEGQGSEVLTVFYKRFGE